MPLSVFKVLEGFGVDNSSNSTESLWLNGTVDPSQAPGVPAPISSFYTRNVTDTDAEIYQKFGVDDTDWRKMSTAESSGIIGPAEDADYTDGLFTDFTTSTPVGTAVDRFNEILKALAPQPAPVLDYASMSQTGVSAKLSFGTTNVISGYSNVDATAGNSVVDINGTYSASGNRRGLFASGNKFGILNDDVTAKGQNYPADSFGPGDQGELRLEVNGTVIHTCNLVTFGSGSSYTSGSGFDLSAATSVKFEDGTPLDLFKYRTGTWTVLWAAQRSGFNYVRINHYFNNTDHYTGYYEWVNDPDANALSASGGVLDSLTLTGSKYLSGVQYHTGGTAEYDVTISNIHRNCYSTSAAAISFTGTNCSANSLALGNISTELDTEVITDSLVTINSGIRLLNGSILIGVNADHPLKADLSSQQVQSISGLLIDSINTANTDLVESFCLENYRVPSVTLGSLNNYAAQADLSGASWVSTNSIITGDGYSDGLLVYNGAVRYLTQGVDSGDFRNVSDGNANGPSNGYSGNPNYSSASGTRYYYRRFRNTSGATKSNFKINISGTGSFVSVSTGVSAQNLTVELKFPAGSISTATGWMDAYNDFATGQWSDGNGARSATLGNGRAMATWWGLTLGTKSIAANEYIVIRIASSASWTGNISNITLEWL
jgi:hypothetical protein